MQWTKDQRKIIDARDCNLLVSAAAGSGKTAVLVERIIEMIADTAHPMDIDELLVVTFTKAAAAQMKDKIAKALEDMLQKEPENEHYMKQLNYISQANILTIDSFCYQVVKENFHVLGLDPAIRIGEPGEILLLQDEALEQVVEMCYQNPDFVQCSEAFSADKTDDRIMEYILKIYTVCSSYPRPEQWIANAKASLHVESEEVFVKIPFVIQYFEQLHQTARGIRAKVQMALDIARSIDGPLYMEKTLLADVVLVEDLISARTYTQFMDVSGQKFATMGRAKKGDVFDIDKADRIKSIRDEYKKEINAIFGLFEVPFDIVLEQFADQEKMLTALLDAAELFRQQFLQAKLAKGILEFSDVEHFALQVLCEGYDEEERPVPSAVGREMSEQFREILIDEYQDSNYLQEAILQCVSRIPEGVHNIFMVGDVKQSIYSFRMARPDLFMEKYHSYSIEEGQSCRKLLLKNNFRSRANVLETINYIFYQIMGQELGGIEYTEDEALVPGREFAQVPDDEVELLLGESKDFEFVQNSDEEMTAQKEENLDENLEDIGKIELEATMIAKRIQRMMGEHPYQIVAGDGQTLQNVDYKDMVILFRTPSAFSQIFQEVLMNYNIPVRIQNENGYFDTVEIRMVLSMLRVIDNPFNDVEMTAVLRGYYGGCNSNELAVLALVKHLLEHEEKAKEDGEETGDNSQLEKRDKRSKKQVYIYQAVRVLASDERERIAGYLSKIDKEIYDSLCVKCGHIVQLLEDCMEKKSYMGIGQLLRFLYFDTGFYYYAQAMPEGTFRIRNLKLLLSETKSFEDGAFQSLFDFLQYVNRLQQKAVSLGGDPSVESTENAVRIMSIHKSKGLEFPVVFLAGTGKNFNLMDTKTPLIIHSDYYIGAKYIDPVERCGNDTFKRKAFAALMLTQSIAEELRLLYVGLTRAKEKLIITGVTRDIPALVHKHEMVLADEKIQLGYSNVHSARNYLDLIVAALLRNKVFHAAMKEVPKRLDKKGEQIISAEYVLEHEVTTPDIRLAVETYDFKKLTVMHLQSNMEQQTDRRQRLKDWLCEKAAHEEELQGRLSWTYANERLAQQKSKLSVTEIKRIYETENEPSDVVEQISYHRDTFPVPRFLAGEEKMNAAARGTWVHKAMELFDHANLEDVDSVTSFLKKMWSEGRLPEETRGFLTADKFVTFAASKLGIRMRQAAREAKLYKEKQFVVGVPASRLVGETSQDDSIVVQGIVDAYFAEGDDLVLVDYKTDHIKDGQEEELIKRYRTQMQYYKVTLEQLTGKNVKETYLYSFALGKEIAAF
ncbi:MAG: helicase-exonuclease AddAB subunit AddA [Lachnospiraceae bacterium]|nr:helicase-exonuclease AddAB subunit AddA [Lachnospiraceae bacterium]